MPALKALHLRIHRRLRPFLFAVQTRDLRLVSEKLLELASHPSGVFVAGYFAQNFIEIDVAPIGILLLSFGYFLGFGAARLGFGISIRVLLVSIRRFASSGFLLGLGNWVGFNTEVVRKVFQVLGRARGHPNLFRHACYKLVELCQ